MCSHLKKEKIEKYITASIVRISPIQESMTAPDTSVSFITLKEKGKENGGRTPYTGKKEIFSNNITLSSNLPINQK